MFLFCLIPNLWIVLQFFEQIGDIKFYGFRYSSMKGGRAAIKREVKITDEQNNQFAYQNFQSRSRLDARLWLECRFNLVKSLMEKVSGMGLIKGKLRIFKLITCDVHGNSQDSASI